MLADVLRTLLDWLLAAPPALVYLVLGFFAALENVVPPVPADVVVLFGSVLAARGGARVELVFLVVWLCNVAGAMLVYFVGRRHGSAFFEGRWGALLLKPGQIGSLSRFYLRWGFWVIFISRFLPMFRAVVPVFAGVAGVGVARAAVPIAGASALWYGALVWVGSAAGRNWEELLASLESASRWLWLAALAVAAAVAGWWWRSR